MTTDNQNKIFKLAYGFVNDTNSHIYLTGKAGTGKTTFLRYVKMNCEKNLVVVAPTGVAAINAGGVTMHSFFQLPFNPFIPNAPTGFGMNANVVDKNTLLKNIRFNSQKRKLL
jgi:Cdc6-like AAA superfamily ATPase